MLFIKPNALPSVWQKKMTHPALGRIQKYLLRRAFDEEYYQSSITGKQLLPHSVLYREKEQFADGIGRSWITTLRMHATEHFPEMPEEDAECALYKRFLPQHPSLQQEQLSTLIESRNKRRRQHTQHGTLSKPGRSQPTRWYPICHDQELSKLNLTKEDALHFLRNILGWSSANIASFSPSLDGLNRLIMSMLERVPFHNLTLLTRDRRPPTMDEIKIDMMSGIGGPCAVVNAFFAVLLDRLGFGPGIYLLRWVNLCKSLSFSSLSLHPIHKHGFAMYVKAAKSMAAVIVTLEFFSKTRDCDISLTSRMPNHTPAPFIWAIHQPSRASTGHFAGACTTTEGLAGWNSDTWVMV